MRRARGEINSSMRFKFLEATERVRRIIVFVFVTLNKFADKSETSVVAEIDSFFKL